MPFPKREFTQVSARVLLLALLAMGAALHALPALCASADSGSDFLEYAPDLGGRAHAAPPLLTIFYDASTYGELHPCPT